MGDAARDAGGGNAVTVLVQGEAATNDVLPRELMDLLVCPVDKQDLRLEGTELVCTSCGRRYPVEDGIPNMLVEDAR